MMSQTTIVKPMTERKYVLGTAKRKPTTKQKEKNATKPSRCVKVGGHHFLKLNSQRFERPPDLYATIISTHPAEYVRIDTQTFRYMAVRRRSYRMPLHGRRAAEVRKSRCKIFSMGFAVLLSEINEAVSRVKRRVCQKQ